MSEHNNFNKFLKEQELKCRRDIFEYMYWHVMGKNSYRLHGLSFIFSENMGVFCHFG